jgi:hypothetical protein
MEFCNVQDSVLWFFSYISVICPQPSILNLNLSILFEDDTDIIISHPEIDCFQNCMNDIVTYSGCSIHDGTLLHSKKSIHYSRKLLEHVYTSDLHGPGTLIPIGFFQQDLLWQSSNTHSHSCNQKASKYTSGQSIVGLSVHLHITTAPQRIHH